jgi:hypothetical protein
LCLRAFDIISSTLLSVKPNSRSFQTKAPPAPSPTSWKRGSFFASPRSSSYSLKSWTRLTALSGFSTLALSAR